MPKTNFLYISIGALYILHVATLWFASRHGEFARKSPIAKTRCRLFLGNQSSYIFHSFFIGSRRSYQTRFENFKPFEIFLHFQNLTNCSITIKLTCRRPMSGLFAWNLLKPDLHEVSSKMLHWLKWSLWWLGSLVHTALFINAWWLVRVVYTVKKCRKFYG